MSQLISLDLTEMNIYTSQDCIGKSYLSFQDISSNGYSNFDDDDDGEQDDKLRRKEESETHRERERED